MVNWKKIQYTLDNSISNARYATLAGDELQEVAFLVRDHVHTIVTTECKNFLNHIHKAYHNSFVATCEFDGYVTIHVLTKYSVDDVCALCNEMEEYYVSTLLGGVNESATIQLCINGAPINVRFDLTTSYTVSDQNRNIWAKLADRHQLLRGMRSDKDIATWGFLYQCLQYVPFVTGDLVDIL